MHKSSACVGHGRVDSTAYNIVEMTHHVWLLAIIDYLIEKKREIA